MLDVDSIVEHLKSAKIIAYPTETLWGLGVDALNSGAVEAIFELKGRDIQKAISILVRDIDMAKEYAHITPEAEKFLEMVWPGPVTVVFPRKSKELDTVCGQGDTIGLRCSSHPLIQKLVWTYENPITTTSANPSGQASAQSQSDLSWLPEDVLVCPYKEPEEKQESKGSTVVLWTDSVIKILREGDVSGALLHRAAIEAGLPGPADSDLV